MSADHGRTFVVVAQLQQEIHGSRNLARAITVLWQFAALATPRVKQLIVFDQRKMETRRERRLWQPEAKALLGGQADQTR